LATEISTSFFCLFVLSLLPFSELWSAGVEVGQYDNPRDLTLKIHDPYAQKNTDLMQPVVGEYSIKVLPSYLNERSAGDRFNCRGLYFKQVGKLIYIDIRRPPTQNKAGSYDLAVTLNVPGEAESSNRLRRHIVYTDSATDVMLVIDNSRSMKKNDPTGMRFQACENFVHLASLSESIQNIGIIKFSAKAQVLLPWTSPKKAKEENVGRLLSRSRTGNFTNINDALELSARLFEDSVATEKVVVLLTDGKNEPDIYRDTHKLLLEQGVRVYTVGLSNQADSEQLKIISDETGGEFFEAVDDAKLMRIYNKIAQQLSEFKPMMEGQSSTRVEVPISGHDKFVDINLYNYPAGTEFELLNAESQVVESNAIMGDGKDSTKLLRLSQPNPGLYTLRMKGGGNQVFSYDINTHSRLFMKLFPLEKKYLKGELAHVAVSLAKMEVPILNANIQARIMNENGAVYKELKLFDDGVHGDNHADDGVYCAICPLDLQEGQYWLELEAEGVTPQGQKFVRLQKDHFTVLEASDANKDYFLASILPLYLDLGHVEQGGVAKASLRLSFEGRSNRVVHLAPSSPLMPKAGGEPIPWSAIELPEAVELKPSEARVFTMTLKMPLGTVPGPYSGELGVRLGDQEVVVPIDVLVKEGALSRVALKVEQPDLPMPRNLELDRLSGPTELEVPSMLGEFTPSESIVSKDSTMTISPSNAMIPKEVLKEDSSEEIKPDLRKPIHFSVSPAAIPPFVIGEGQFASLLFELENLSSHSGNVFVELDGVGEVGRTVVELDGGARSEVVWNWEARELAISPRDVHIRFFTESMESKVVFSWLPPPVLKPWFFYWTIAILAIIGLVYGILYLLYCDIGHGFVSASAWVHLVVVILAFIYFLPPEPEKKPEIEVEDLVFEMLPEEALTEEAAQEMMMPEDEKLEMRTPQKDVSAMAAEVKMDRPKVKAIRQRISSKAQIRERMVELTVSKSSVPEIERSIKGSSMTEDAQPTVLSVNDRPARRAILRKRSPEEIKSESIKVKASTVSENRKLVRERRLERRTMDDFEQRQLEVKRANREAETPSMISKKENKILDPKFEAEKTKIALDEVLSEIEREAQDLTESIDAKDLALDREAQVSKAEKAKMESFVPSTSAANVSLKSFERSMAVGDMKAVRLEKSDVSVEMKVGAKLVQKEELARLDVREAQSEVQLSASEVAVDYVAQEATQKKSTVVLDGVVEPQEQTLELRAGRRSPRVLKMLEDKVVQAEESISFQTQMRESASVLSEVIASESLDLEGSVVVEGRPKSGVVAEGQSVVMEKTDAEYSAEKERADVDSGRLSPSALERRELLGGAKRESLIIERGVGKRTLRRSSSSSMRMKRLSPTKILDDEKP
jgi:hypothetical protein